MGDTNRIFDGLLVLQYKAGNQNALATLVKRYHLKLCRHSYWYTHDMEASKDIVQDSWGTIINKLGGLKDPNFFRSWAMRIVTRKSLDFVNKRKREIEKLHAFRKSPYVENEGDGLVMEILKLRKAIPSLPEEQQLVLRLFYTEEYSLKEISTILDVSIGTVKSRLYHAREKLKTIIK